MKKEVSLDPQMRMFYTPLPLFLTPEAPGRVIGMGSLLISVWSQEGRASLSGSNSSSAEVGALAITTVKVRTIMLMRVVSPTKEEGSPSGALLSRRDAQRRT